MRRAIDLLRLRLRALFRRDSLERELDAELRFHLEELTAQNVARGMAPAQARTEALRHFGSVAQLQEQCRDKRRTRWFDDLTGDVRYALRLFAKSPGFTAVALLSLALGIGSDTTIFHLVNTVILRDLPVREPQALVRVAGAMPGTAILQGSFSYPTYQWLRAHGSIFSHVFTWHSRQIEAGQGDAMEWIAVDRVSDDYFVGLGVQPALGRVLGNEDQQPAVAVISHAWWRRRFHDDPAVLGRPVRLGGVVFTIVGVAPERFFGAVVGAAPDVYIPLSGEKLFAPNSRVLSSRNSSWLPLMARLAPGVSLPQAQAALNTMWPGLIQETAPQNREGKLAGGFDRMSGRVESASNGISPLRRRFEQPLRVLAVVVGVVLLIACVNLSNLLLARSLARRHEFALRAAVGAGRGRLFRQILTESLLLAMGGGVIALLFTRWSSSVLAAMLSTNRAAVRLDLRWEPVLIAYTAAIVVFATLLFGVAPALRAIGVSVHPLLKEGTGRMTASNSASRSLLVVQVALSLLLVAGAALFLRTFLNLGAVPLGFEARRVLIADLDTNRLGLQGPALGQFYRDLDARLRTLPGVETTSLSMMSPIQNCCWGEVLTIEGYNPQPGEGDSVFLNLTTPGFFRAMGTRLLRGREFTSHDSVNAPRVAVVNESFARRYFPDGNALGRSISLPKGYKSEPMQIVGIVEDSRFRDLRGPVRLAAYFPVGQSASAPESLEVVMRTRGEPMKLATAVQQQVHSLYPVMPVKIRSLASEVGDVMVYERLLALLSGFLGAVALTLAAAGLYGTVSCAVARRTSEIGVRVALGASRASVLWLIMRQSLVLISVGLAVGSAGAVYMSRFVGSLLFGVQPADPLTLASAAVLLGTVALLAAWIPARRGAAVDPVRALRYE